MILYIIGMIFAIVAFIGEICLQTAVKKKNISSKKVVSQKIFAMVAFIREIWLKTAVKKKNISSKKVVSQKMDFISPNSE